MTLFAPRPGDSGSLTAHWTRPGYRHPVDGGWNWITEAGGVRVGVVTSRREVTTSTVVVFGGQALLVDPGWDPGELAWIAADLTAAGTTVCCGFATHAHHDHVLWHPGLGDAPRWASGPAADDASANRALLVGALGPDWPAELAALVGQLTALHGDRLPWGGPEIELITHDAHARGHTALWIPATRTLIAGDMLSDVELPLLEDSSPADYDAGLAALEPFVGQALVVIPGHGRPAIGSAAAAGRWAADRRYLDGVTGGADQPDPRRSLPGMREAHEHNRSRAGLGSRTGSADLQDRLHLDRRPER
jgi:glyoxylase-like metal-dependent hydrolase (beta-lactamase superfamily II)